MNNFSLTLNKTCSRLLFNKNVTNLVLSKYNRVLCVKSHSIHNIFKKKVDLPVVIDSNSNFSNIKKYPYPQFDNTTEETIPKVIVESLDMFVVGQENAKKMLAVALRDRWRRQQISDPILRKEISPSNIILVGPSGSGKTEIASRIANIVSAPFIKVAATKYTEVGFIGDDTQSMVHDLVEQSYANEKKRVRNYFLPEAKQKTNAYIVSKLQTLPNYQNHSYEFLIKNLMLGEFNDVVLDIDEDLLMSSDSSQNIFQQIIDSVGPGNKSLSNMMNNIPLFTTFPLLIGSSLPSDSAFKPFGFRKKRLRKFKSVTKPMSIVKARPHIEDHYLSQMMDEDQIISSALFLAENRGIIFIDEFDKIISSKESSPEGEFRSKRKGVQKELLTLMDGITVNTKFGKISTKNILFITSGSFLSAKVSDIMPELQGRLPITIELQPLGIPELKSILQNTKHNLLDQEIAMLKSEGIKLQFTDEAVNQMATVAHELNTIEANLGARRLKYILASVLDDIKYNTHLYKDTEVIIDENLVTTKVASLKKDINLRRYII